MVRTRRRPDNRVKAMTQAVPTIMTGAQSRQWNLMSNCSRGRSLTSANVRATDFATERLVGVAPATASNPSRPRRNWLADAADNPVHVREFLHGRDDIGTALAGALPALSRSYHRRDRAPQETKVAKDVAAPGTAANQTDVSGHRRP